MFVPQVYTYTDVLTHLSDFLTGHGQSANQTVLRRCIERAYQEISGSHDWSFFKRQYRLQIHAAESTGTVAYQHSGGAYERQLTMSGSTFPTWARDASIRFNDIVCDIEERKSSTVATLDASLNPGADVAACSFVLYPKWYTLPPDFVSLDAPLEDSAWLQASYIPPNRWAARDRYYDAIGDINYYTIMPPPDLIGSLALFVSPPSDSTETLDLTIKRRPIPLRYSGQQSAERVGTISVTAGSATATGSGTSFDSAMVGAILRIGSTSTTPTGWESDAPWAEQRSIEEVASTTSLTLDQVVETTRSAVGYVIASPIDMEIAAFGAFLSCCELQLANARNFTDKADIKKNYQDALFAAKTADARVTQRRVAGAPLKFRSRLANATSRPNDW